MSRRMVRARGRASARDVRVRGGRHWGREGGCAERGHTAESPSRRGGGRASGRAACETWLFRKSLRVSAPILDARGALSRLVVARDRVPVFRTRLSANVGDGVGWGERLLRKIIEKTRGFVMTMPAPTVADSRYREFVNPELELCIQIVS